MRTLGCVSVAARAEGSIQAFSLPGLGLVPGSLEPVTPSAWPREGVDGRRSSGWGLGRPWPRPRPVPRAPGPCQPVGDGKQDLPDASLRWTRAEVAAGPSRFHDVPGFHGAWSRWCAWYRSLRAARLALVP